jgi:predicted MFS family arabinose efflux permease
VALIFFAVFAWGQRGLAAGFVGPVSEGRRGAALRPAVRALVIGAMATLSFSGEGAVLNWAAIFLRQYLGADPMLANAGYQAFAIAMAVTRFFGDNVRRRVGGVTLVRAGCLLAFMGLLLGPLTGNTMLAIVGYGLAGIGFANVVPVLLSAAGALPDPEVQVAAVSTMGYAGLLAGPPLLGLVAHVSSLAGIFSVAAAGTVLNAALASACAPPKAKISQSTAI